MCYFMDIPPGLERYIPGIKTLDNKDQLHKQSPKRIIPYAGSAPLPELLKILTDAVSIIR